MSLKTYEDVTIWMPLYIGDYLSATSRLNTEQQGAYIRLLIDHWKHGPPPDDDKVLARICGLDQEGWDEAKHTLAPLFEIQNGKWVNRQLSASMEKALMNRENARKRGVAGAAARWSKHSSSITQAMDEELLGITSTSTPSTAQLKHQEQNFTKGFQEFWDMWGENHRRTQKIECFELWKSAGLESSAEIICDHVKFLQSTNEWSQGYMPKTFNYLSNYRWLDNQSASITPSCSRRVI